LGFYKREAGPASLRRGSWVGFGVLIIILALFTTTAQAAETQCEPQISSASVRPFWASYGDYLDNRLSVDESLQSSGNCTPCRLQIARLEASEGVSLETPMPLDLGELPAAATGTVRIKFRIPEGVRKFHTRAHLICDSDGAQTVSSGSIAIEQPLAWANETCPVAPPEMTGRPVPADTSYGPRLFTVTVRDADGNPVAGGHVKWHLSDPIDFRIIESETVTDASGRATALVTPPQYFICIAPYFDRGLTAVAATMDDGLSAQATFIYSRCAPAGATPPWATGADATPL